MQVKLFEIRDRMTFIPVVCVRFDWAEETDAFPDAQRPYPAERYLIRRCGYGPRPEIIMTKLAGGEVAHYDPHAWGGRTLNNAHLHISDHWNELESGQVIDVEFILGETTQPKQSEAFTTAEDH